jgi:hypothetical protein
MACLALAKPETDRRLADPPRTSRRAAPPTRAGAVTPHPPAYRRVPLRRCIFLQSSSRCLTPVKVFLTAASGGPRFWPLVNQITDRSAGRVTAQLCLSARANIYRLHGPLILSICRLAGTHKHTRGRRQYMIKRPLAVPTRGSFLGVCMLALRVGRSWRFLVLVIQIRRL